MSPGDVKAFDAGQESEALAWAAVKG